MNPITSPKNKLGFAVMVTAPGETHVASPVSSIVAMTVFDDFQVKPSAKCNSRLV